MLLVSGQPHAGERVWRNLLKADPSVDLIHFTILRPPEKQDATPIDELSLIAFPYRELFSEKLRSFDLVIFDRYYEQGILPMAYFENIANYVQDGGALLILIRPGICGADEHLPHPAGQCAAGPAHRRDHRPGLQAYGDAIWLGASGDPATYQEATTAPRSQVGAAGSACWV